MASISNLKEVASKQSPSPAKRRSRKHYPTHLSSSKELLGTKASQPFQRSSGTDGIDGAKPRKVIKVKKSPSKTFVGKHLQDYFNDHKMDVRGIISDPLKKSFSYEKTVQYKLRNDKSFRQNVANFYGATASGDAAAAGGSNDSLSKRSSKPEVPTIAFEKNAAAFYGLSSAQNARPHNMKKLPINMAAKGNLTRGTLKLGPLTASSSSNRSKSRTRQRPSHKELRGLWSNSRMDLNSMPRRVQTLGDDDDRGNSTSMDKYLRIRRESAAKVAEIKKFSQQLPKLSRSFSSVGVARAMYQGDMHGGSIVKVGSAKRSLSQERDRYLESGVMKSNRTERSLTRRSSSLDFQDHHSHRLRSRSTSSLSHSGQSLIDSDSRYRLLGVERKRLHRNVQDQQQPFKNVVYSGYDGHFRSNKSSRAYGRFYYGDDAEKRKPRVNSSSRASLSSSSIGTGLRTQSIAVLLAEHTQAAGLKSFDLKQFMRYNYGNCFR